MKFTITTNGMNQSEKKLEYAIRTGGGNYYEEFNPNSIDIVIAKQSAIENKKLEAAINSKKDCFEWIENSIKAGFAIPTADYKIDLLFKKRYQRQMKYHNDQQTLICQPNKQNLIQNQTQ